MKNILVTVEFEEKTNLLIGKAAELAEKFEAKLWLVHIAPPEPDFVGFDIGPQYVRDTLAEELREEHRLLQKYANQLKARNIAADGLLIQGATVEMILEECEKLNIDLVIIGHHDHNLLYKIFVGSTDLELVEQSKIPVMVVPLD